MSIPNPFPEMIARPAPAIEFPKTLFIDRVSPALAIDWASFWPRGFGVPLTASGRTILDVRPYRKVSVLIGSTKSPAVQLQMGKISGSTLAASSFWSMDDQIHTFDIAGPEISLILCAPITGSPAEKVQLWLHLTS